MAKKLFATSNVAPEISFDLEKELKNAKFKVLNTIVKRDVGEETMQRIKSPKATDLADKAVHVFCVIEIDGVDDLWMKDMQLLNKGGFQNVIDVKADGTFTVKDGASITSTITDNRVHVVFNA